MSRAGHFMEFKPLVPAVLINPQSVNQDIDFMISSKIAKSTHSTRGYTQVNRHPQLLPYREEGGKPTGRAKMRA